MTRQQAAHCSKQPLSLACAQPGCTVYGNILKTSQTSESSHDQGMWLQHHQTADNLLVKSNLRPLLCVGNFMEMIWSLRHAESLVIIHNEGSSLVPDDLDLLMTPSLRPLSSDCARYHLMMSSMLFNGKVTSSHHPTCQQIRSAQGKHIEIPLMLQRGWWLGCVRVTLHVSIVMLSAKSQAFSHPVSLAAVTEMWWMDYIVTQGRTVIGQ